MYNNLTRLFREVQSGDGSSNGPSLTDILPKGADFNDDDSDEGVESDGFTLKPGYMRNTFGEVTRDPNYKQPNQGAFPAQQQQQQQQQQAAPVEGVDANGALLPGYKKEGDKVVKDPDYKPAQEVIEGVNPDGSIKEGYQRNDDGTVTKKEAAPNTGGEEEEDEDGSKFMAAIEAITGRSYQIKYPEGVLPTSPEGLAIRENYIIEQTEASFEEYLRQTDARAYAYMLHRQRGGDDESFMNDNKGYQLPTIEELKGSADIQARIYTQDLMSKGLDADTAKILVDTAIKNNQLLDKSTVAWTGMDKAQKDQLAQLQADKDKADRQFAVDKENLNKALVNAIRSEISFLVPETQQPAFQKYILDNLRYDDGKFYLVQPMEADNFKTVVESLFFQYKKGDLTTLIRKQAQTKAAQALKLKSKTGGITPGSGSGASNIDNSNLPLSQILPQGSSTTT